jgi:hypothetical protein
MGRKEPAFDVERVDDPPVVLEPAAPLSKPPPGILLSPTRATVLSVVIIICLALAFAAGLLMGLSLRAPADDGADHADAAAVPVLLV